MAYNDGIMRINALLRSRASSRASSKVSPRNSENESNGSDTVDYMAYSDSINRIKALLHAFNSKRVSHIDLLDDVAEASTSGGAGCAPIKSQSLIQVGGAAPRTECHDIHNLE